MKRQINKLKNSKQKRSNFQNRILDFFGRDIGFVEARPLIGKAELKK